MTVPDILRLVAGLLLLGAGIWQYRRRSANDDGRYGNQSAVLLIAVGALLLLWVVGGLLNPATAPAS